MWSPWFYPCPPQSIPYTAARVNLLKYRVRLSYVSDQNLPVASHFTHDLVPITALISHFLLSLLPTLSLALGTFALDIASAWSSVSLMSTSTILSNENSTPCPAPNSPPFPVLIFSIALINFEHNSCALYLIVTFTICLHCWNVSSSKTGSFVCFAHCCIPSASTIPRKEQIL